MDELIYELMHKLIIWQINYLKKFELKYNIVLNIMENTNSQSDKSEILTNIEDSETFYKLYNTGDNKITNILNKYEKTKIIFERYQMIANGSLPYIPNAEKYDDIYVIVEEELKQKKIPFIIKRNINNVDEYLKLEDFIIL